MRRIMSEQGLSIIHEIALIHVVVVEVHSKKERWWIKKLQKIPAVISVSPNHIIRLMK